jgi:hypothetical protein
VYVKLSTINAIEGEPSFITQHRKDKEQKQMKIIAQQQQEQQQQQKQSSQSQSVPGNGGAEVKSQLFEACMKGQLKRVMRWFNVTDDSQPTSSADITSSSSSSHHGTSSSGTDDAYATLNLMNGKFCETPLHAASKKGFADIVRILLEAGANPTLQNKKRQTPYAVSKGKPVRDTFRRFMAQQPDAWDYKKAGVPSALTAEMEAAQQKKQRAKELKEQKRAAKEEALKLQAAEEARARDERHKKIIEASRMTEAGMARQMRAAAALARRRAENPQEASDTVCAYCFHEFKSDSETFERLDFKYCSLKCLQTHRKSLQSMK